MINKNIINLSKNYVNMLLSPLKNLYYHQYEHSLDVCNRCKELGEKEGLNKEDIELLQIAALFHDTGFIIQYDNNEYIGAKIAKNFLKGVLYPQDKIEIIEKLILATNINYKNPKNILEKIIKDADIDNLGRDDFFEKFHDISTEIEIIKKIKTKEPEWIHGTIEFLDRLKYQTKTQIKERGYKKETNLKTLKMLLKDQTKNYNK